MDSNEDFALVATGSEFAKIKRSCVPSVFASLFLFENNPIGTQKNFRILRNANSKPKHPHCICVCLRKISQYPYWPR